MTIYDCSDVSRVVFLCMTPCRLIVTDVLEGLAASVVREEVLFLDYPENGDSKVLRNVCNYLLEAL